MVMEGKKLEIIRGELTHKEEKQSSNDKTYWLLEIKGCGKASVWDKKVAELLKIGKSYEYEAEVDGKYTTIKSIKEMAIPTSTPELLTPLPEHTPAYIPTQKDNASIMAQVALKSAVERANGITSREVPTSEIIAMGQEYMLAMKAWAIGKVIVPVPKSPVTAPSSPAGEGDNSRAQGPGGKTPNTVAKDEGYPSVQNWGEMAAKINNLGVTSTSVISRAGYKRWQDFTDNCGGVEGGFRKAWEIAQIIKAEKLIK